MKLINVTKICVTTRDPVVYLSKYFCGESFTYLFFFFFFTTQQLVKVKFKVSCIYLHYTWARCSSIPSWNSPTRTYREGILCNWVVSRSSTVSPWTRRCIWKWLSPREIDRHCWGSNRIKIILVKHTCKRWPPRSRCTVSDSSDRIFCFSSHEGWN